MKIFEIRLYRTVLRAMRPLLLESNKKFTETALVGILSSLSNLNLKTHTVVKQPTPTVKSIQEAFRRGTSDDIDQFLIFLPTILRYADAARVLSMWSPQDFASLEPLSAAVFVSRLHHPRSYFKNNSILDRTQMSILSFVSSVRDILKDCPDSDVYKVVSAYNYVFLKFEGPRFKSDTTVAHLLDQLLNTEFPYRNASPLAYALLSTEVIKRVGLVSYGVSSPRIFMSRVLPKPPLEGQASEAANQVVRIDGAADPEPSSQCPSEDAPTAVEVSALEGRWVGASREGMLEYDIRIDEAGNLVATKLGFIFSARSSSSSSPPSASASETASSQVGVASVDKYKTRVLDWSVPLKDINNIPAVEAVDGKQKIKTNVQLSVTLFNGPLVSSHPLWNFAMDADEAPTGESQNYRPSPATTLTIVALPASALHDLTDAADRRPHVELVLDATPAAQRRAGPSQHKPNKHRIFLTRSSELYRTVFVSTNRGMIPASPLAYLDLSSSTGVGSTESPYLSCLKAPASGLNIALRMTTNICTMAMAAQSSSERMDDSFYWNSVCGHLSEMKRLLADTSKM